MLKVASIQYHSQILFIYGTSMMSHHFTAEEKTCSSGNYVSMFQGLHEIFKA